MMGNITFMIFVVFALSLLTLVDKLQFLIFIIISGQQQLVRDPLVKFIHLIIA